MEKKNFFFLKKSASGTQIKNLFHSNFNSHINKPIKSNKFKQMSKSGLNNEVFNIT